MNAVTRDRPLPGWRSIAAALGLGWSLFGVYQFWTSGTSSESGLMASGMTAEQAALYAGLPLWMTAVFAVGVFGGVIGSVLLLMRNPLARPVLAASLLGYVALFIGDWALGVFAAFGASQVAVLSLVVAIAAGLLWLANDARR